MVRRRYDRKRAMTIFVPIVVIFRARGIQMPSPAAGNKILPRKGEVSPAATEGAEALRNV